MEDLFSRKGNKNKPKFVDLDGQPLHEGDTVMSLRYDLGECIIIKTETGMVYESLNSGDQVSYARMIDAATGHQKVRLLSS